MPAAPVSINSFIGWITKAQLTVCSVKFAVGPQRRYVAGGKFTNYVYFPRKSSDSSECTWRFLRTDLMVIDRDGLQVEHRILKPEMRMLWDGYPHPEDVGKQISFAWQSPDGDLCLAVPYLGGYKLQIFTMHPEGKGYFFQILTPAGIRLTSGNLPETLALEHAAHVYLQDNLHARAPEWNDIFRWQRIQAGRQWVADAVWEFIIAAQYRGVYAGFRQDGSCSAMSGRCRVPHNRVLIPYFMAWLTKPAHKRPLYIGALTCHCRLEGNPHGHVDPFYDQTVNVVDLVQKHVLDEDEVLPLFARASDPQFGVS